MPLVAYAYNEYVMKSRRCLAYINKHITDPLFLHFKGHLESVECLLDVGADKNVVDTLNYTPLHTAVQNNRLNVVQHLISVKCNVNRRGIGNFTPLHVAANHGYVEVLEALIKGGAFLDCQDASGNTPLILTARARHYIAMKALIQAGCDLNKTNNDGYTALHFACHKAGGHQILLDAGADPNICDKNNISPLIIAASEGFDSVVKALLDAKCDVNIANDSIKKTALHILAFKGHSEMVDTLIYGGADINLCDSLHHTPLWYAIKNKKVETVRLLLRAYSHVDSYQCGPDIPDDACPAKLAVNEKMLSVIKLFILTGFDYDHLRTCLRNEGTGLAFDDLPEFSHWLDHVSGAQTLKQICRKWIRHHLGKKFYRDLHLLPIPDVLRDYLLMKELDDH